MPAGATASVSTFIFRWGGNGHRPAVVARQVRSARACGWRSRPFPAPVRTSRSLLRQRYCPGVARSYIRVSTPTRGGDEEGGQPDGAERAEAHREPARGPQHGHQPAAEQRTPPTPRPRTRRSSETCGPVRERRRPFVDFSSASRRAASAAFVTDTSGSVPRDSRAASSAACACATAFVAASYRGANRRCNSRCSRSGTGSAQVGYFAPI